MKYYITGTRRGLGKSLEEKYGNCNNIEDCDIFINCKHNKFEQVELLYKAAKLNKRIINIGSHASDFTFKYRYAVEKRALREANNNLFCDGVNTTCLNFGYFDSPKVDHVKEKKMTIEYCVEIIDWVLKQPYRLKELTICP